MPETNHQPAPDISTRAHVDKAYGELPLSFVANEGQADLSVDFIARGEGYMLALASGGLSLTVPQATIRMDFVNANSGATPKGSDKLPGKTNYLIGNKKSDWRTGLSSFAKVEYSEIYRGVDVVYYGNKGLLEYDLVVSPGADPANIKLDFQGIDGLRVDTDGNLLLRAGSKEIKQHRPVVYQEIGASKKEISASYVIDREQHVGFSVADYDRSKPLVIDPILSYASYLGGTFNDHVRDVTVDSAGNLYITGETFAANFPITPGAFQTTTVGIGGNFAHTDVFITKLNAAGNAVIYSTYLGGTDSTDAAQFFLQPTKGNEVGRGIAVDSSGNAYVTGTTTSIKDFPTTLGAFQTTFDQAGVSSEDAFVTKLNADGTALIFSTRLGGRGSDNTFAIKVDASGNSYVTGDTASTDFPKTPGAFRTTGTGMFITKLTPTGSALDYSTLIASGTPADLALDDQGNVYMTGEARSSDFPTTPGAFQTVVPGGDPFGFHNGFVLKLNPQGTGLVYSSFLAGSLNDRGSAIDIDPNGNAYVSGATDSNNFPTTAGAFDTTGPGSFVTKMNPGGSALVYSTIIGPSILDLAVTPSRDAYLVGHTGSTLTTTPDAFQSTFGGGGADAFVMKLNTTGSALVYSTYLGGNDSDAGTCIAVDQAGSAYVGGETTSTNFPVTPGAFQITPSGDHFDIGSFVAKFAESAGSTFRISGRLTDGSANGLANVPVRLSGAMSGIQWTTATGDFSFGNLPAGGNYTVTPLNQRFNFAVPSRTFDNLSSNQTADFLGTARNLVFFSVPTHRIDELNAKLTLTVNRTGDTSLPASVNYATSDASASERSDYTIAQGTLRFAAGETSKTFDLFLTDDSFAEAHETVNVTLSDPNGVELGDPSTAKVTIISGDTGTFPFNPADNASFFVRQHYVDFLNRLADPAGLAFWTGEITGCGTNTQCIEVKRVNVSAAFYLSIEFQETGFLVYRMYKAAYGNLPGTPVPVRLREFMPDAQQVGRGVIVTQPGWDLILENNKQAFAGDFVARSRFTTAHPTSLTPQQFVDALFANAGVTPSSAERDATINEFVGANNTADAAARGRALRRVAEHAGFALQEKNRAFVLMQYFGYLRRNPDDAPDANFDGYSFWLNKLNQFNGNFVQAEMVKAFIVSIEYRQRFGP